MKNRILFVTQEMSPFFSEETPMCLLNLNLSTYMQSHGFDTRNFMPKFQEINERRNQLHDVIRLSGINIIIQGYDHPLIIKVASLIRKKIQVYFTDSKDYFRYPKNNPKQAFGDDELNGERCIFFARSVIETIKKLCWTPSIVHCSGWMSALIPLYLKKAYCDEPFFKDTKVIVAVDNKTFKTPINTKFTQSIVIDGVLSNDLRSLAGFELFQEDLMRFAIDFSDGIIFSEPCNNNRLINYAETSRKPVLYGGEDFETYRQFYKNLL